MGINLECVFGRQWEKKSHGESLSSFSTGHIDGRISVRMCVHVCLCVRTCMCVRVCVLVWVHVCTCVCMC